MTRSHRREHGRQRPQPRLDRLPLVFGRLDRRKALEPGRQWAANDRNHTGGGRQGRGYWRQPHRTRPPHSLLLARPSRWRPAAKRSASRTRTQYTSSGASFRPAMSRREPARSPICVAARPWHGCASRVPQIHRRLRRILESFAHGANDTVHTRHRPCSPTPRPAEITRGQPRRRPTRPRPSPPSTLLSRPTWSSASRRERRGGSCPSLARLWLSA